MTISKKSLTEAERLAFIHKTIEETAPLEDFDMKDLVDHSIKAYEKGLEEPDDKTSARIELETAILARRVAEALDNPSSEFFNDLGLSVAPMIAAIPFVYFLFKGGILLPDWIPYTAILLIAISAVIVGGLLFISGRREARGKFLRFRHVAGALVGGLVSAAIFSFFGLNQAKSNIDVSLALVEGNLEKLALSSLENKHLEGEFLAANVVGGPILVNTVSRSKEKVVYKANFRSLPGIVFLNLSQENGEILWHYKDKKSIRAKFVLGKVQKSDENKIVLKEAKGKVLNLGLSKAYLKKLPHEGNLVAVAYEPKELLATCIQEIK